MALLEVRGLRVELETGEPILEDVSFDLAEGEILGIVGESGSGKTTTALALLGYSGPGVRITEANIVLGGERIDLRDEKKIRRLRGSRVSYVPQDPGGSLNPSLRVAAILQDMIRAHIPETVNAEVIARESLEKVNLPPQTEFMRRFPHQLSGGQQQRVCIASALSCNPPVLVLDEPTTGLDVVTQARILEELERLRHEERISCVYVTHDLGVIAAIADRIAVMYAGRIVEIGPAKQVLARPAHPYTRGLISSAPDHTRPRRLEAMPGIAVGVGERPAGCAFASRCANRTDECTVAVPVLDQIEAGHDVRCIHWRQTRSSHGAPLEFVRSGKEVPSQPVVTVEHLHAEHRGRGSTVVAASDVSFSIQRGGCVALVGESGSGKTTIARVIAGLHPTRRGAVYLHGSRLGPARRRTALQHRAIQMIFQNPDDALNPRQRIREQIARPARLLRGMSARQANSEADRLIQQVRLPDAVATRYPREISGGERQRVSIARALAANPEIIICDEVTSSLDVSVQAAVLVLLNDLRAELGLGLLLITHDLGVVATIADECLVLSRGVICERGPTTKVLAHPEHPYTQRLLAAVPSVSQTIENEIRPDGQSEDTLL